MSRRRTVRSDTASSPATSAAVNKSGGDFAAGDGSGGIGTASWRGGASSTCRTLLLRVVVLLRLEALEDIQHGLAADYDFATQPCEAEPRSLQRCPRLPAAQPPNHGLPVVDRPGNDRLRGRRGLARQRRSGIHNLAVALIRHA